MYLQAANPSVLAPNLTDADRARLDKLNAWIRDGIPKRFNGNSSERLISILERIRTDMRDFESHPSAGYCACGIAWISDKVCAVATKQLSVTLQMSKSAINKQLSAIGWQTVPANTALAAALRQITQFTSPSGEGDRQWTFREFSSKTAQFEPDSGETAVEMRSGDEMEPDGDFMDLS
jgi:hypothetical protein